MAHLRFCELPGVTAHMLGTAEVDRQITALTASLTTAEQTQLSTLTARLLQPRRSRDRTGR
jgi:hypothetical protein